MKKLILYFSLFLLINHTVYAQSWSIIPGMTGGANISALYSDTVKNILYAGGYFAAAGGVKANGIAKWNGTKWDSLSVYPSASIAIIKYNNDIYSSGPSDIYKWNDTTWQGIASGSAYSAFGIYKNELYASYNGISKWNGTKWDTIGTLSSIWTNAFAVYKNELYVGGGFTSINGIVVNNIAKWDGTKWSAVGTGGDAEVNTLLVYNGELYAGGSFTNIGGITANCVAKWDGTKWTALGNGMSVGKVRALAVYNNVLYAGGGFAGADNNVVNNIAKWDGTKWLALGTGTNNIVLALAVYDNKLYVGGNFTIAGGKTANYIAVWNETTVGINENHPDQVYLGQNRPNPFTNKTEIDYYIPSDISNAQLKIYDNLGKELKTLVLMQGYNTIELNIGNLAGGAYTYCLVVNGSVADKKTMLYLK